MFLVIYFPYFCSQKGQTPLHEQKYGMKCLLSKNAFKTKIKQTLSEILASEDCYIDLPEIVQKVKLNPLS